MKRSVRPIALLLSFVLLFGVAACTTPAGGETDPAKIDTVTVPPKFDYATEDLSPFVDMGGKDWRDITLSVEKVDEVTDADVTSTLNSYIKNTAYYPAIQDKTATVKKGDTLYLYYMGITVEALQKAVTDGKISDTACTGMSYYDIRDLGINFQGGTTSSLLALKIGSAGYVDGFEDGLVGLCPADYDDENPVRLYVTFPVPYGNAELEGKEVIFFCRLFYIADTAKAPLNADTVTVEELNAILGMEGESAYPSIEACREKVRSDLEKMRTQEDYEAHAAALHNKLTEIATFRGTPDAALEYYALSWLSQNMEEIKKMYKESPSYYAYYFGEEKPSLAVLLDYYGYDHKTYLSKMKEEALPAVRGQLVFWSIVRAEGMTLTEAEIAQRRADFIEKYGENVFDGVSEERILEQFLYDKFTETAIAHLKEKGAITYTEPKSN